MLEPLYFRRKDPLHQPHMSLGGFQCQSGCTDKQKNLWPCQKQTQGIVTLFNVTVIQKQMPPHKNLKNSSLNRFLSSGRQLMSLQISCTDSLSKSFYHQLINLPAHYDHMLSFMSLLFTLFDISLHLETKDGRSLFLHTTVNFL